MAAMPPAPSDELPHAPVGGGWSESWTFDFATADGQLGGSVRYVRFADHAWYEALLAGPRRQLLAVLDHDVPFRSSPLEVRTTGLWADHICETPLDHWTLGLEAFALGVDDPLALLGRQYGDVVALGFDLEWETDGPVLDDPASSGYAVPCRVHGEVLIGASVVDLDAVGHRRHRWGGDDVADWSLSATLEGGERWVVDRAGGDVLVRVAGSEEVASVDGAVRVDRGRGGLPERAEVVARGRSLAVEVLDAAPLAVPTGRTEVRALCRVRAEDGRTGVGWMEERRAGLAIGR